MIESLLINKYQSIVGPCRIGLKEITFLYGPNSAGKSAVIDILNFFRELSSTKWDELNLAGAPIMQHGRRSLSVGIEFTTEGFSFGVVDGERQKSYQDLLYSLDDFEEEKLSDALKGKIIKLMVKGGASDGLDNSLAIYINDNLLISIDSDATYFNEDLEVIDGSSAPTLQTPIVGRVYINKRLPEFKWLGFGVLPQDYLGELHKKVYQLYCSEDDDEIIIRGLLFPLLEPDLCSFAAGRMIFPHFGSADGLTEWGVDEYLAHFDSFSNEGLISSGRRSRAEYEEFLRKLEFSETPGDYVQSPLWSWANQINLLLEYFFIRLYYLLNFTHVPGERSIIDSRKPNYFNSDGFPIHERNDGSVHRSIGLYLGAKLGSKLKTIIKERSFYGIVSKGIVDTSLARLLPSLGKYLICPLTVHIIKIGEEWSGDRHGDGASTVDNILNFSDNSNQDWQKLVGGYMVYPYLSSPHLPNGVFNFKDVGSGLSFVLPILAAIDMSSLSIIEQPELHLHPRAQCELADVFICGVNNGRRVVVESHSENILLRLSRRIRESTKGLLLPSDLKITPNQIAIHYFKPNGDGSTSVHLIRYDEHGDFLDLWPDGFFGEREREIFGE